jgi:DNA-directed RNA polymerase subunit K/omega
MLVVGYQQTAPQLQRGTRVVQGFQEATPLAELASFAKPVVPAAMETAQGKARRNTKTEQDLRLEWEMHAGRSGCQLDIFRKILAR